MILAWNSKLGVHVDATAAKGIFERRGISRVRLIEVNHLWIQEQEARRMLPMSKADCGDNPADLMTKNVGIALAIKHMTAMGIRFADGRSGATGTCSALRIRTRWHRPNCGGHWGLGAFGLCRLSVGCVGPIRPLARPLALGVSGGGSKRRTRIAHCDSHCGDCRGHRCGYSVHSGFAPYGLRLLYVTQPQQLPPGHCHPDRGPRSRRPLCTSHDAGLRRCLSPRGAGPQPAKLHYHYCRRQSTGY